MALARLGEGVRRAAAGRAALVAGPWSRPFSDRRPNLATPTDFEVLGVDGGLVHVDGYGPGGFTVSGVDLAGPVLLYRTAAFVWRLPAALAAPSKVPPDALAALHVVRPAPELLLVGCGKRVEQLSPALVKELRDAGIVVDAMDTPNAAATFNILTQEGRNVAAALFPPA